MTLGKDGRVVVYSEKDDTLNEGLECDPRSRTYLDPIYSLRAPFNHKSSQMITVTLQVLSLSFLDPSPLTLPLSRQFIAPPSASTPFPPFTAP